MSECPKVAYIVFLSSCLRLSGSHYSLAVTLAAAATNVRHLYLRLVLTRGVISLSLSPASACMPPKSYLTSELNIKPRGGRTRVH